MRIFARPIDCIIRTDLDGEITPIRFRVAKKNKTETVVNVDRVIDRVYKKIAGEPTILFKCIAAGKPCELKYFKVTCKWMLFRA